MSKELLPQEWQANRMTGNLPEGDVELWFAVFTDDGEFMGAAPAQSRPRWLWRGGKLCCDYSPVVITMMRQGRYSTGLICAVSPVTRAWQPLLPVGLGKPGELKAGNTITIIDGIIAMTFGLPDPAAAPVNRFPGSHG